MLIGICGMGVVGKSTANALRARGKQVISCDKNPDPELWYEILQADIIMVCTPESVAPEVVRKLASEKCKASS